jgi:hypothetical protein
LETRRKLDWGGELKGIAELKNELENWNSNRRLTDTFYPDDSELAELAEAVYYYENKEKHKPPAGWQLIVTAHHQGNRRALR